MKITDIIRRSSRSLKQAKARTFLTSGAIAVGAFTIVLSLALGTGVREYTESAVRANTDVRELTVSQQLPEGEFGQVPEPQIYDESSAAPSPMGGGGGFNIDPLTRDDIEKLGEVNGVESVDPIFQIQAEYIQYDDSDKYEVQSIATYGTGPRPEFAAGGIDDDSPEDSIVITSQYREALGFDSDEVAIGESVVIAVRRQIDPASEPKEYEFIVRGVSAQSNLALRTSSSLLISRERAEELYDYSLEGLPQQGQYFAASVMVGDADMAETIRDRINNLGYEAQTAEDILGVLFQFINVLQGILIGLGGLAVLTAVFGIINTQYISVLERTQQIGLMKALGARRRDVGRLFKLEAAWLGFIGGALGAILAVITGVVVNPVISETLGIGDHYLLLFEPISAVVVVLGLMLIAVIAGILPSRKAAKLDPIEALRTE